MLNFIAIKCTEILLKHRTISKHQESVYIYGFELFWSTTLCIISILVVGAFLRNCHLALVFFMFFMPIRMAAGGYHAKSYGSCFVLTNSIAVMCTVISKSMDLYRMRWLEYMVWGILIVSFIYIWNNSPVIFSKHPQNQDIIIKNRKYTHVIIMVEITLIMIMKVFFNNDVVYNAIITSFMVATMIFVMEKRRC